MKEPIDKDDFHTLLYEEIRDDLPDKPLKWKVALRNLTAQLLIRNDLIL